MQIYKLTAYYNHRHVIYFHFPSIELANIIAYMNVVRFQLFVHRHQSRDHNSIISLPEIDAWIEIAYLSVKTNK